MRSLIGARVIVSKAKRKVCIASFTRV